MANIFPPHLPLIYGQELTDHLTAWAAARIPHVGAAGFGPCWAAGVVRGNVLAAVVIYHDWQPEAGTVQVSVAADTPRWASREVLAALLGLAFNGGLGSPIRKVWSAIASPNERALRFNAGIGFTREAVLRHHFAPRVHAIIASMMHSEFRRIYAGKEA
jgi:RimJ/RimL family protein N-acetyltransferase